MNIMVEMIILHYLPRARKIEDKKIGNWKIDLLSPVKQMEESEALTREFKEFYERPTCLNCQNKISNYRL